MQQPQSRPQSGHNANRNRKRSLQRQSGAGPVPAGPPGFESLHLQDGQGMHSSSQPGQKQARLQQHSRSQGLTTASAAGQAELVLAEPLSASPLASQGARTSSTTRAHLTDVHFADLPICSATKRALAEVLKYDLCTTVQAQSVPPSLQGVDMVCKAKTGFAAWWCTWQSTVSDRKQEYSKPHCTCSPTVLPFKGVSVTSCTLV